MSQLYYQYEICFGKFYKNSIPSPNMQETDRDQFDSMTSFPTINYHLNILLNFVNICVLSVKIYIYIQFSLFVPF